jgi:hypothetical protein
MEDQGIFLVLLRVVFKILNYLIRRSCSQTILESLGK